jgi:hypothetical protein
VVIGLASQLNLGDKLILSFQTGVDGRSLFVQLMEWLDKLLLVTENWLILLFQKLFKRGI